MYTVKEKDMIATIVAVLESEEKIELANIIRISDFVYDPQWDFSYVIPDQKNLYATIKVPVNFVGFIKENLEELSKISISIYNDDKSYRFLGINKVGYLAVKTEQIEFDNKKIIIEKDSVYSNFIKFLTCNSDIEELQKKYLFEACEAGNSNNMLSATVMLGCSAELLLIQLCDAFYKYLKNNGMESEATNFKSKVINAKTAYIRLDEFLKRAEVRKDLFKELGFENVRLNFNFLDIIRQTRNDSGHPTGNTITQEQFRMILSNYQAFIKKAIKGINVLPSMKE